MDADELHIMSAQIVVDSHRTPSRATFRKGSQRQASEGDLLFAFGDQPRARRGKTVIGGPPVSAHTPAFTRLAVAQAAVTHHLTQQSKSLPRPDDSPRRGMMVRRASPTRGIPTRAFRSTTSRRSANLRKLRRRNCPRMCQLSRW